MSWRTLRRLAILHFAALVVFRIVYDQDEFSNWDLIGLLNATSFPSLGSLMTLPQVHLAHPFRFPTYNSGTESVLSLLLHRVIGPLWPHWSNAGVVLVYDAIFVWAVHRLLGFVFVREAARCLAWLLLSMSPVILTFAAISSFNMQAFATVAVGLLGAESVLRSRFISGALLIAFAFLSVSQAYGLAYYVPVFCIAWLAARSAMIVASRSPLRPSLNRNAAYLLTAIVMLTTAVQLGSEGKYIDRIVGTVTSASDAGDDRGLLERAPENAATLVRAAFGSNTPDEELSPGFAPYFLLFEGTLLALVMLAPDRSAARRGAGLLALAWMLLIALGYAPALVGSVVKSQRCFFGDFFLALAIAPIGARVAMKTPSAFRFFAIQLGVVLLLSDVYYVASLLRIDHSRNHTPLFDYDASDGVARHDLTRIIAAMRSQAAEGQALLVIDDAKARDENRTDPAVFHARFLRQFGSYRARGNLVFSCEFCDIEYGCPFPEVRGRPCASKCCYKSPLARLPAARPAAGSRVYLWTYLTGAQDDAKRQQRLATVLGSRFLLKGNCYGEMASGWRCFEFTPITEG